ncbi:MAG: helix-turn-helix domain-containing protein [Maricaulis sp.]|jgi:DNA-binding MarR family transcriptional regulator|uniref:MarR family transcriptional regulator n=1 Tax=Maricaulis sp. TaxID=1486257 RepID=UPI001B29F2EA|nr:helix-turn-helix domain-containing protein [Maricaulis sp.]MBO6730664.1 MarR family transcriptional regulator [Maricaulis sp.]MBO6845880.1 MarR family transcriptional regulator [Maricaulis sp.]MBO6878717.1 MarR family transcriptional regulator [Maricaulis sp.]MDM7985641.1 helix-turn-helix domain-containing protein [Maricaulis sp.]
MASAAMISLEMLHRVSSEVVRAGDVDLSSRQFAVLLSVFMRSEADSIRDLSTRLDLPKPAVTRALDVLESHGFVRRKRDRTDKRDVSVHRTVKGAVFLYDYGENVASHAEESVKCLKWITALRLPEPTSLQAS